MFRIRAVEPSWAPCNTLGKLYVIALGRWRATLLRLPTAEPTMTHVTVMPSQTEPFIPNLVTYEWSLSGQPNKD